MLDAASCENSGTASGIEQLAHALARQSLPRDVLRARLVAAERATRPTFARRS
jgi:hypothetical protein